MSRYRYCEHCCKRVPSEGNHTCRPAPTEEKPSSVEQAAQEYAVAFSDEALSRPDHWEKEHARSFLAGMEAEHEAALLVGYIRALKFAISYTDHCYEGLGAELKLNEKSLADLLAKGRG